MGWSCRKAAGEVHQAWIDACVKNSGSSNVWSANGEEYFFEISRTEHRDGAITGSIYRNMSDHRCRKTGSFRIEGDGKIKRAPKFLKQAAKEYLKKLSRIT